MWHRSVSKIGKLAEEPPRDHTQEAPVVIGRGDEPTPRAFAAPHRPPIAPPAGLFRTPHSPGEGCGPPSWGPVRGAFFHATPAPAFAAEEISESAPVPVKKIFVNFQRQLLVVGQFCVRYCFADSAHADAFRDRFGGERLNTRPGFACYKMKDRT
jgi:hypothetical protein